MLFAGHINYDAAIWCSHSDTDSPLCDGVAATRVYNNNSMPGHPKLRWAYEASEKETRENFEQFFAKEIIFFLFIFLKIHVQ